MVVKSIPHSEWEWMPHPAHFICSNDCRFCLATRIGNVIVSTVGEYLPHYLARETFAQMRGVKLKGTGEARDADYLKKVGYEEIGLGRMFETMVFRCKPNKEKSVECCRWVIAEPHEELDMLGYNDGESARKGHMKLCEKWADVSLNLTVGTYLK